MTKAAVKARKVKEARKAPAKKVDSRLEALVRFLARRAAELDYADIRKGR